MAIYYYKCLKISSTLYYYNFILPMYELFVHNVKMAKGMFIALV